MLAREMESDYTRVGASGNRSRVSHAAAPVLIGAACKNTHCVIKGLSLYQLSYAG